MRRAALTVHGRRHYSAHQRDEAPQRRRREIEEATNAGPCYEISRSESMSGNEWDPQKTDFSKLVYFSLIALARA